MKPPIFNVFTHRPGSFKGSSKTFYYGGQAYRFEAEWLALHALLVRPCSGILQTTIECRT